MYVASKPRACSFNSETAKQNGRDLYEKIYEERIIKLMMHTRKSCAYDFMSVTRYVYVLIRFAQANVKYFTLEFP